MLSGLLLGLSRQLLEKQLNLGIGAPVASATVGTKKATKDHLFPWGRQRQLVVLGEETRVVGWGFGRPGQAAHTGK